MKTIELSLSPKYVSGWGVEEAVREILQNAIDQKADGAEVSVSYDRETLSILTDGARLKTSTLLLGESGKDDERYIGKYGEGYKLALLVLTRERKPVKVVTDAETWTPEFRLSETFGEESLQIDVEETGVPGGEFTEFRIGGISPAMMRSFGDRFIALERFMGRDIGAKRESEYGTIMLESRYKGKFYVGGLFVQEDTGFAYGYDFLPEHVSLDRDRKAINHYELKELTARALTSCGDVSLLVNSFDEKHLDVSDASAVLDEIDEDQCEGFKRYYFEKNGLGEGTFVGTKGMWQALGSDAKASEFHEENKIVSKIIAIADDALDEFEGLEAKVSSNASREAAVNAFGKSDYKKILVWLKGQPRLSKRARAELREIIDNSSGLRFLGMHLIQDEIDELLEKEGEDA